MHMTIGRTFPKKENIPLKPLLTLTSHAKKFLHHFIKFFSKPFDDSFFKSRNIGLRNP